LNTRKNILHIIDSIALGGAETILLQTIQELTHHNHILVYLADVHNSQPVSSGSVKVYNLSVTRNILIPVGAFRLRRIIRKNNVDIVHAHLWKSTLIARLATPKSVRLLFTLHSLMSKDAFRSRVRLHIEKMFYHTSQELLAVSETVKNDYRAYIPVTGKQHVLYNFVDNKFFKQTRKEKTEKTFRLISVGNLKEAKNYPFLLRAFSKARDQDFTLDIYGWGSQADSLQKTIETDHIPVRLMGIEKNVETVLPGYDLFVMASSHEGFCIALAEAMACGLPVLISDIPVFREIVGDAGFYFSIENDTDFSTQLAKIYKLHQQGELFQWSTKSRERASKIASKEFFFRKLESIYSAT
jgi:glycosyltransferase involved in cell wall biosynthesis